MCTSTLMSPSNKRPNYILRAAIAGLFIVNSNLVNAGDFADDLADLKAQVERQNQKIQELQKLLENLKPTTSNSAPSASAASSVASVGPTPVAAVPESLRLDQDGTAIINQYPDGLTLFDNNKTRLKIYGLVEPTLSHVTQQKVASIPYGKTGSLVSIAADGQPASARATTFGFQTSWFSGNRLGFSFEHDLGSVGAVSSLKAIAQLESEFELPTGSLDTSNTLFKRDAWAGFYSPDLGRITFGRQNTLTRDVTQTWGDPYGTAEVVLREGGYTNVNNFKQLVYYSGGGPSAALDSAVVWKKKFGDHWLIGLAHSFGFQGSGGSGGLGPSGLYGAIAPGYASAGQGGPVPGDSSNGATNEASLAYNGLSLGGDTKLNANYSYNSATIDDLKQTANLIGGNIVFGPLLRLNAGYITYTAEQGPHNSAGNRTDKASTISGSVNVGQTSFSLGFNEMNINNAGFGSGGKGSTIMNPFVAIAPNQSMLNAIRSNLASGHKKAFYGAIVYHWDNQTDLYIASDYAKVDGGISMGDAAHNGTNLSGNPALGVASEVEIATGVRFKF